MSPSDPVCGTMTCLAFLLFALLACELMKIEKIRSEVLADTLRVAVLVLDDCNTLSFASTVDPMRAANRMAGRRIFDWQFVTATGKPAQLTSGIEAHGGALSRLDQTDLLLVVAGFGLERHDTPALRASLRRIAGTGAMIAGIDGGPWLMASAGILDGYKATTHWEDLEAFAARFPAVTVLKDRYHIDGARLTCGGALPAIDLMLTLIADRFGSALAARVAGVFIHDRAPDPARPQRRSGMVSHTKLTARAAEVMESTLESPLTIPELARRLGVSARVLEQQFRNGIGTTPKAHYLHLRLTEALRLITDTDRPILDVALSTGFASPASFARAFRAAYGTSARTLRTRTGSLARPTSILPQELPQ